MANPLKELSLSIQSFQMIQEIPISASPKKTWATLINPSGWFARPDMPGAKVTLELFAGGRWYVDGPDGLQMYMGEVTMIEPEKLLRVSGPMGLSHMPVNNVMIYELQPKDDGKSTLLRVGQRMFGYMDGDVQTRFAGGWKHFLGQIKAFAEKA